jgi:hypothetical protein
VIGDHAMEIEGAAAGVASDTPKAGGQSRTFQPFHIAD